MWAYQLCCLNLWNALQGRSAEENIESFKMGEVKEGWIKETMRTGSEIRKAKKRNPSWKPEWKRLNWRPRRRGDEMLQRILKK